MESRNQASIHALNTGEQIKKNDVGRKKSIKIFSRQHEILTIQERDGQGVFSYVGTD